MTSPAKKIQYLDLLRLFATLCVILLHCVSPYLTNAALFGTKTWWACNVLNEISRTGVPLFFMISGYLLLSSPNTLDFMYFYRRRLGRILIPFLIWDIIYYITGRIANGLPLFSTDFFTELLVSGSEYHLWFVYTIAGIYLFLPFLKRILDACTVRQTIWLLALVSFAPTLRPFVNIVTPLYIYFFDPLMNGYLAFFLLGYLLGRTEFSHRSRILFSFGGLTGFLLGIVGNYLTSSPESLTLIFNGAYQLNHFLCAAAIFVLCKNLPEISNRTLSNALSTYSSITYGIYLLHVLVLDTCNLLLPTSLPAIQILLLFVITTVVSSLVMLVFSRIKYINKLLL